MAEMNEVLGKILAEQQEEQSAAEARIRAHQEQTMAQVTEAQSSMLQGFLSRKQAPPVPTEVQEIVNALQAQPRLIPPVKAFLGKLVAAINKAIDEEIAEALGPEQPPTE